MARETMEEETTATVGGREMDKVMCLRVYVRTTMAVAPTAGTDDVSSHQPVWKEHRRQISLI
jgi:hypothetical protein